MDNTNIQLMDVSHGDISLCRELCNKLMRFQQAQAVVAPEVFDLMSFDTRMKYSYEHVKRNFVLLAMENNTPVGYVYATVEDVHDGMLDNNSDSIPPFARELLPPGEAIEGFYPSWVTPQPIGHVSNLYIEEGYRKTGAGKALMDEAMAWLEAQEGVKHLFVHISNGNEQVIPFYMRYGFTFSHEVFGGFIHAYHREK